MCTVTHQWRCSCYLHWLSCNPCRRKSHLQLISSWLWVTRCCDASSSDPIDLQTFLHCDQHIQMVEGELNETMHHIACVTNPTLMVCYWNGGQWAWWECVGWGGMGGWSGRRLRVRNRVGTGDFPCQTKNRVWCAQYWSSIEIVAGGCGGNMLGGFEQVVEVAGCRDNEIEQGVDILTPNNGYWARTLSIACCIQKEWWVGIQGVWGVKSV